MNTRQLTYFEAVARHQSYSKAAEELFVSQPSLSNAIKRLELDVDCKLFERSTREVSLTEMGEVLYDQSIRLLRLHTNTLQEMKEVKRIGKGEIHIANMESSRFWLPAIIQTFHEKHPTVKLNFSNIVRRGDVESALKNYKIHFAITVNHLVDEEFTCQLLFHEPFVLLTNKNHPFTSETTIPIAKIKNENFIQYPDEFQIQQLFLAACEKANFSPKALCTVDDLELACSLVEYGLGVTVVPKNYLNLSPERLSKLHQLDLTEPTPMRSVYLSYINNRYLPQSVLDFIQLLTEKKHN